jgi:hypothetical protein
MLKFQVDPLMGGGGGMADPSTMGAGIAPSGGPPSLAIPPQGGPEGMPPEEGGEAPLSIEEAADKALQMINAALAQPGVDPEDANFAEAATTALTKILATNQKNADAAAGIGPAHKAMRKAASGGGGGY